jgi:hypothetical protein
MSVLVELSNIVHDYIIQYPEEYKQYIIAYIRDNHNSIQNKLHQLRADCDEEHLEEDNLLIDLEIEELGERALNRLIFGVNHIRDDVQDSLSYTLACKLCQFINEHYR